MSARGREHQLVDTDVPGEVVNVVDVVDVVEELQPGDTALIYLAGPVPGLVAGTVESVMAPGRKRPTHHITFTTPVTDDPGSSQLSVTPHVTPESAHVFIRAYRVNQPRAERRARQAIVPAAGDDTSAADPSAPGVAPEPSIVSGVIGSVVPWGLTWPGHLISYTTPVIDDGSYQFPVNRTSAYAFISAYRAHTT